MFFAQNLISILGVRGGLLHQKLMFHHYYADKSLILQTSTLLHELHNTSANEGLSVGMAHGHEHVLADCDAAAPLREYGRMVLQTADPH